MQIVGNVLCAEDNRSASLQLDKGNQLPHDLGHDGTKQQLEARVEQGCKHTVAEELELCDKGVLVHHLLLEIEQIGIALGIVVIDLVTVDLEAARPREDQSQQGGQDRWAVLVEKTCVPQTEPQGFLLLPQEHERDHQLQHHQCL